MNAVVRRTENSRRLRPNAPFVLARARLLLLVLAALPLGCVGSHQTARVFNGEVVLGPAVPEEAYAAFAQGAVAEAERHWARALEHYEEAARALPRTAALHLRMGRVACRLGVSRRADDEFARAEELDPSSVATALERGQCDVHRGRFRAALAAAQTAERRNPASEEESLAVAQLYSRARAPSAALAVVQNLVVTHPDSAASWTSLQELARANHDAAWLALSERELQRLVPHRSERCPAAPHKLDTSGRLLPFMEQLLGSRGAAANTNEQSPPPVETVRRVRTFAVECRLEALEVAEAALLAGSPSLALVLARKQLAANPSDGDALALSLLAAHRSGDEAALSELMLGERKLDDISPRARRWVEQLLGERGFQAR